jgi:hypothetical protein
MKRRLDVASKARRFKESKRRRWARRESGFAIQWPQRTRATADQTKVG